MDEKVEQVEAHRHRYGLNACLRAVGLSKGTWHYRKHRLSRAERDAALKAEIVSVIESHPDYGYRRIHAELGYFRDTCNFRPQAKVGSRRWRFKTSI